MAKRFSKDVKLGGLSIGDSTARMSFHFSRDELNIVEAESLFSGSRCNVKIEQKDDGDQRVIKVDGKKINAIEAVEGVCDIKGFRTTAEAFSAGLTFLLSEVGVEKLARFANRDVTLTLKRTGDAPKKEAAGGLLDKEDEEADADADLETAEK